MTGTQEYTSHDAITNHRDLFCSNCGKLLKMNQLTYRRYTIICPECGTNNDFLKEKIRQFDYKCYKHKHPIVYWARKYKIPVNSCYMAFRRRGIGNHKQGIGEAKLVNQREFLAGIVFTTKGREIVSKLILREWILTQKDLNNSI